MYRVSDTVLGAQEVEEVKAQLSAEQNKVFKLEVELAEAQQKLQKVAELEKEVANYRRVPLSPT